MGCAVSGVEAVQPLVEPSSATMAARLHDCHCETDRQDLVWLKLWVGYVRLDLLDDSNRDVVFVKGPQAL